MAYKPSSKDIKQFLSFTGAQREVAVSMLEACNGNVEVAVGVYLDTGAASSEQTAHATPANHAASASGAASSGLPSAAAAPINVDDDDGVRAPIPAKTEVLVGGPSLLPAARRRTRGDGSNPFNHMRDFQAEGLLNVGGVGPAGSGDRTTTLAHLFRPPVDIMFRGTLEGAREAGSAAGKWVLADIHDQLLFDCQKLNRDLWRDQKVRQLLEDNFVFWQVQADSIDGQRYQQFYPYGECPHIAFLDPRTGERLEHYGFMDAKQFTTRVDDFLSRHALPVAGLDGDVCRMSLPSRSCTTTPAEQRHTSQRQTRARSRPGDEDEAAAIAAALTASVAQGADGEDGALSISSMSSGDDTDGGGLTRAPLRPNTRRRRTEPENGGDVGRGRPTRSQRKRKQASPSPPPLAVAGNSAAAASASNEAGKAKRLRKLKSDPTVTSAAIALAATSVNEDRSLSSDGLSSAKSGGVKSSSDETTQDSSDGRTSMAARPAAPEWSCDPGEHSVRLLLRLPDGAREQCRPPASATVQSLIQYVDHLGFPPARFSLMTPYPRRNLNNFGLDSTLASLGFCPTGTLCIEEKD